MWKIALAFVVGAAAGWYARPTMASLPASASVVASKSPHGAAA